MLVNVIKVDEITFNKVFDHAYKIKEIDSNTFTKYLTVGRHGLDKKTVLYDKESVSLICRKLDLVYELAQVNEVNTIEDNWRDICLQIDHSAQTTLKTVKDIYIRPYAKECNKYMLTLLSKYYSEDEIEEIFNTHIFTPKSKDDIEIHEWIPTNYKENIIYKVNNCIKYDINSAYLYQLSLMFPKAKMALVAIRTKINVLKKHGDVNGARRLKDIVNFFIGDLVNNGHKATRSYIVNEIRKMMNNTISLIGGELLYANTDGFIVHNPDQVFTKSSNKLGEFKSEIYGDIGTVYLYLHRGIGNSNNYQIYQYRNVKNDIEKIGTIPLSMREKLDLEQGLVVDYEEIRDGNKKNYILKEQYYGTKIEES